MTGEGGGTAAAITVATWNINSIKVRLENLLRWLREASPDVVLLQELKVADEAFPSEAIADAGYNAALVGQKTYNGVAVLAKQPIEVLATTLPGDSDDVQSRYLEALVGDVRVASIYLPNGNPIGSEKFAYKLAWLERLREHVRDVLDSEDAVVFGGDYNVAPTDDDVYDPSATAGDALCQPDSRAAFRRLLWLGLTDAVTAALQDDRRFTWWDYRGGGFAADHGMRIDHLLLSPQAADRLVEVGIDRTPRGWEKPSDHTPVWCRLRGAV